VLRAEAIPAPGEPGTIVEVGKDGFVVATADGGFRPTLVAPAGKRAMAASDFVNGHRPELGERLGEVSPQQRRPPERRPPQRVSRPRAGRRATSPGRPPAPSRSTFVRRVTEGDAYSNLALGAALERRHIDERDTALATELVYGTLRRSSRSTTRSAGS